MSENWSTTSRRDSTSRQQRRAVRVVVVARETLMRQALASLVARVPEFRVVQYTDDTSDVAQLVEEVGSGVLLVDVEEDRPRPDNLISRALAVAPDLSVVVLTPGSDAELAALWMAAGVKACVPKVSSGNELQNAIRWTAGGAGWVSPRLLPRLIDEMNREPEEPAIDERLKLLTGRELEVLGLMIAGRDPKEIAKKLALSLGTVRTHVRNITDKLGVHSAAAAVSLAHAAGLGGRRSGQKPRPASAD